MALMKCVECGGQVSDKASNCPHCGCPLGVMNDAPNTVDVLLTGKTLPGADIDQAATAFAKMAGMTPEKARALISCGKSKLLWRGLSPEKGLAVTARFASKGVETVMRPGAPAKPATRKTPQPQPAEAQPAQPAPPPPAPKPELPQSYTNSIGMEFVLIPAGSFLMGSPEGVGRAEEHPQHPVTISRPFYLGRYPVTQAQWQVIMGSNPSRFKGPASPVERVSWNDAQLFIAQLNAKEGHNRYRLPTEAEWEYACRAGTETKYFFGDDDAQLAERYAWTARNSGVHTHPVGQKEANPWGFYDLYGNVWEWVADWYSDQTYYTCSPQDPTGPVSGKERVLRGGSWTVFVGCRSASRESEKPSKQENDIGFRLAMAVDTSAKTGIAELPGAVNTPPSVPSATVNVSAAPKAEASQPQSASPQQLPAAHLTEEKPESSWGNKLAYAFYCMICFFLFKGCFHLVYGAQKQNTGSTSVEEVAQMIAERNSKMKDSMIADDQGLADVKFYSIGRTVYMEYTNKTRQNLTSQEIADFDSDVKSFVIPNSCKMNANNPAFPLGLRYMMIYKSIHGHKLSEFIIDKSVCDRLR